MAQTEDTQVQAKVWLKPPQIDKLRTVCYDIGVEYLQQRNETIIATLADTGLRVGELVSLNLDHLRDGNAKLYLPSHIQKDYPNANSPPAVPLRLADDTKRLISSYLNGRWKDSPALFPSRSADRITEQGVRDMLHKVAAEADISPFKLDGTRGDAGDVTPHALRHSVAYRMLNVEEGNTMYDVRKRLRHRSIQTTERIYEHVDEV